jgi:hypothetical protein
MKAEKTQPGNPNQLTQNGHVLPRASIARFEDSNGMVEVCREGVQFKANSTNPVFCAKRMWDQKAEDDYLELETEFQKLASVIDADHGHSLTADENCLTTKFYALVRARTVARRDPTSDARLGDVVPVCSFNTDSLEKLEKRGYVTCDEQGVIAGRTIVGSSMQSQMDRFIEEIGIGTWHVATTDNVEFLVSDSIDRVPVVPISPTVMLQRGSGGLLSDDEVRAHNERVRGEHDSYFFGRDISKC